MGASQDVAPFFYALILSGEEECHEVIKNPSLHRHKTNLSSRHKSIEIKNRKTTEENP